MLGKNLRRGTGAPTWDISTASYSGDSLDGVTTPAVPKHPAFKPDGLIMYIPSGTTVFQWTLSTAWDLTTASYASKSLAINAAHQNVEGLAFSDDGSKLYVLGNLNGRIGQYTLSTPWDISTGSYASKESIAITGTPNGLVLSEDGSYVYHSWQNVQSYIARRTLTTPFDISTYTTTGAQTILTSSQTTAPRGLGMSSDGKHMYVIGSNEVIYEYDLPTGWSLTGASYSNNSFSTATEDTLATGLTIASNGYSFFVTGDLNDKIYKYDLS